MKILLAWDDPKEAELLALYLSAGDNEAAVCLNVDELLERTQGGGWEALLLSLTFPSTPDEGFSAFTKVSEAIPGLPIVLAYRPAETIHLPRFVSHGLRTNLSRDNQHDFMFLALSTLEASVANARAVKSQKLYQRLADYLELE